MNLAQLEAWFFQAMRAQGPPSDLENVLSARSGLPSRRRLGIYRSAYWARQFRVLTETFERTSKLLGAECFRGLAVRYFEDHPSRAPAVERVGDRFADFLASLPEGELSSSVPVDLARLEWATTEALLAPDAEATLAPAVFGDPRAAARKLALSPSLSVVRVSQTAFELWSGATERSGDERPSGFLAVFRRGFQVVHETLEDDEGNALRRARDGASFGEVCGCFSEPDGVGRATRAVARWVGRRWLLALVTVAAPIALPGCGEPATPEYSFVTGPTMQPGDDCLRCHSNGSDYPNAPHFSAAGTVFPSADAASTSGVSGVTVRLMHPDGAPLAELLTNSVGNFYTLEPLPDGFRVAIEYAGELLEMPCPPPAGNCGACHSLPPIGATQGRIFVPGGGTLLEPELNCETWERAR